MPSVKLKAIIFDIGRVLVRIDVARAMQGLSIWQLTLSSRTLVSDRKGSAMARLARGPDGSRATGICI